MAVDVARQAIPERAPLRDLAILLSLAFFAVGVAGFIPGITTHYGELGFAGDDSGAKLLGVFQVSVLHNLVHLLYGIAGLVLARTTAGARLFLIGGGLTYLVLALYGALIPYDSGWNFVPVDRDDNLLHLGLGLGMLVLGILPERAPGRPNEALAGFLAAVAIFVSAIGLAYRPLRFVPLAVLLALIAAAIGGRHGRLAMFAVYAGAACFFLGLAFAVVTSHPLW
jgi:Domain of unknown function (DUF4383)